MSEKRIHLQNTPDIEGVVARSVSFDSDGVNLKGVLYAPIRVASPFPAVIVTGACTTIKEQMAGTYARELAARGYAALAFDFRGWGESDEAPRYIEDPKKKTQDITDAIAFLCSLDEIDRDQISGLGICASAGYMAAAVVEKKEFFKLALVAPWLHDPEMAVGIYGGSETVSKLIASSETDNAESTILLRASVEDESAVMHQAPYYTEPDRGLIAEYDNKFSVASWKPWFTYDAISSAERLTKPLLIVGSPSIALLAGVAAYEARTKAPLQRVWLGEDVSQFDFYDHADVVAESVDAVAAFLADERY
jgi:dienelactone hydrolase